MVKIKRKVCRGLRGIGSVWGGGGGGGGSLVTSAWYENCVIQIIALFFADLYAYLYSYI